MPKSSDLSTIRRILRTDPVWAAYALLDLEPEYVRHSKWQMEGDQAVALLYRGFDPTVLITAGPFDAVRRLIGAMEIPSPVYFHIPTAILTHLAQRAPIARVYPMLRMVFDPGSPIPHSVNGSSPEAPHNHSGGGTLQRLTQRDLSSLLALYADGASSGEAPQFFLPGMLDRGAYWGVYEGGELIAAAGTHAILPDEGLAAIGSVYTRRDRRGRGHARAVTYAVVKELLGKDIPSILLNVERENSAALRVYRTSGFIPYCEYVEGIAGAIG